MDVDPNLLAVIRDTVADTGLKQTELARFLGIDQGSVSRLLNGKRTIIVSELTAIEHVAGLEPGELTRRAADRAHPRYEIHQDCNDHALLYIDGQLVRCANGIELCHDVLEMLGVKLVDHDDKRWDGPNPDPWPASPPQ